MTTMTVDVCRCNDVTSRRNCASCRTSVSQQHKNAQWNYQTPQ